MNIDIRAPHYPLTDAIRSYTERRVRGALAHAQQSIQRVSMTLTDANGSRRGGVDKRCHLQVVLDGLSVLVIQDVKADLYAAIDCAAERAKRTLQRRLQRRRRLRLRRRIEPALMPEPEPALV